MGKSKIIQCGSCNREEEHELGNWGIDTPSKFARYLYGQGWREVESEIYQCIGLACPDCIDEDTQDLVA